MAKSRRLPTLIALLSVWLGAAAWFGTTHAAAATFTCVPSDANTCMITIPLTSNMNEQVSSTMPDTQQWYASEYGGMPGCPATYTDPSFNSAGDVWTAQLTTDANEPSGCDSQVTFKHVNSNPAPTPYKFVGLSGPTQAVHGSTATFTATVKPRPPAGHVILQRKQGGAWTKLEALTFASAHHDWRVTFKWPAPRGATWTLRVTATATTTHTATSSGPIKVHTSR